MPNRLPKPSRLPPFRPTTTPLSRHPARFVTPTPRAWGKWRPTTYPARHAMARRLPQARHRSASERCGTRPPPPARPCEILRSGIKNGGRFILREGNNLPPRTPADNLPATPGARHSWRPPFLAPAMYAACLDEGRYP